MKKKLQKTYLRVGAAVPRVEVGNITKNIGYIEDSVSRAEKEGVKTLVFPELSLTGYTLRDLFLNDQIIEKTKEGLISLEGFMKGKEMLIVVGAPMQIGSSLYNCAVVISGEGILGVVPKTSIPNYKEFEERRWFKSGAGITDRNIVLGDKKVPFGVDLIFSSDAHESIKLGVEICEDLWMPIKPSSYQSIAGATVLANLSASNELVAKANFRRDLVKQQSAGTVSAYIYSSSGIDESTTDVVFSGHAIISENNVILKESDRFSMESQLVVSDVDIDHLMVDRRTTTSFGDEDSGINHLSFQEVITSVMVPHDDFEKLERNIDTHPLRPHNEEEKSDAINIMVSGLVTRMRATGIYNIVLGLSGGLDSTLAFLIAIKAYEKLTLDPKDHFTVVTMPGFGTTTRTKGNAEFLCEAFGLPIEDVSIVEGSRIMMADLGRDESTQDSVYENIQARYRTNILFNMANDKKALVLGTGDLSEIALGWCTFGGDHLSSYNVNASVAKTAVRSLVEFIANESDEKTKEILKDIVDTPISPELIKEADDAITQDTEDILGPYDLHDFYLARFVRWREKPEAILSVAKYVFKDVFDEKLIHKTLITFLKRFAGNQFKRSVMPDGPKIGSVALSPRGDWRMPSDINLREMIETIELDYDKKYN